MKNKKIKLYGIGNEGNFSYYTFDKKHKVAKMLSKILYDALQTTWEFISFKKDVPKQVNIEKYVDFHEDLMSLGDKSRVDVFYANKKMFVIIHCHENLRQKFNEELFKIAKMPKTKPIKKMKKVRNKK